MWAKKKNLLSSYQRWIPLLSRFLDVACGHNILYQMARVNSVELSEPSLDYCYHVTLSRVNGYRDDLDQGNWHVSKNNVEVGFKFLSLGTLDELLSLDLEERREAVIPARV